MSDTIMRFPSHASIGDKPRETLDFIGSNPISGAGTQKSGIEELRAGIWRHPSFSRTSPPPPEPIRAPFHAISHPFAPPSPAPLRVLQGGRCAVEHIRRKSVRFWG